MTTVEEPARAPGHELAPPPERGSLAIDPAVTRKLAERAAGAVDGAAHRRRLGVRRHGERGARAKITRSGSDLRVQLDVALAYPSNIPEVVAALGAAVTAELEHATPYRVSTVDVTVSALRSDAESRVR